ncbi:uncharacterized protein [Anoplolepis gracilipes]|uniref:uncharacterized protein n=1 Tax=Anoplolepis gracilipes TaxID=354296 RepID=UPI003BA26DBB
MNQAKQGMKRSNPNSDELIDLALAKFFFDYNISFNVVESNLFREFIKLPNPDYKVPSRKGLLNQLLDKVHNEITSKVVKKHETVGVLLIDGWKNSAANTKLVVCTIHTVMDNSMYLNSWDLTGIRETEDALTKIVDEATEIAKSKFNIRIYAVVSDNASAMILMGNSVNLWHVTCASHSGNLLAKSLMNAKFVESVNQLLKEFKQPDPEKEIIKGGGAFLHETDIFKILNTKNLTSPQTYFMVGKKYLDLAELADKLMKIPTSSAQIERLFSHWSFVHSDIRNRLTAERSRKLVEIYYSLKMIDKCNEDIDDDFAEVL